MNLELEVEERESRCPAPRTFPPLFGKRDGDEPVLTEADLRRLDTFSRLTFEHATRSQAKWLQSLAVRVMNSGQ